MQTLRDIRLFAAIPFVAVICLFATAPYAFAFISETSPTSSYDFHSCDASTLFLFATPDATPVIQSTRGLDDPVIPGYWQKKERQQAFVAVERCPGLALAVDSTNGQRKDKKTVPPHTRVASDVLSANSWHIFLPDDRMSIGISQDPRVIPGRHSGYLLVGP